MFLTLPSATGEGVDGGSRPAVELVSPCCRGCEHRAELVQALAEHIGWGKRQRATLVVLAPVVEVPVELQRLLVVIEHSLPDREQLRQIGREIATEPGEWPEGEQEMAVLDAASGLTRLEAENAFSLALVRHGRVAAESIWELKTAALRTGGLLQVWRAEDGFDALGGLGALKAFCRRSLLCSSRDDRDRRARGVLLLGVPGTGKSAFARALGHETGRPTLFLDVGALMGSLVGQTEQNVRRALQTADAMAPCILFVDELEKALSGAMASGRTDSGGTARLFGTLLTWLSEHTSDVYFVGTCNDVSKLPPEFSRAERFDAVFFLDLPGRTAKDAIWELYQRRFGLPEQPRPDDTDWTGAEIRACCRLAALLDLPLTAAAQNVVPVAVTAAAAVEQLRRWADGRCLDAERPGRYRGSSGCYLLTRELSNARHGTLRSRSQRATGPQQEHGRMFAICLTRGEDPLRRHRRKEVPEKSALRGPNSRPCRGSLPGAEAVG